MSETTKTATTNRREFLQQGTALAAGATLLASPLHGAYAGEDNTIHLALIGCGGRGNGAVANALNTADQGPIKLYAMADLYQTKMDSSVKNLSKKYPKQIDVAPERQFVGFDAFKKAIDVLKPGDVAMCTTRAYIRALHVEYAVSKGINVFMEKPFACDPMGIKRMLKAGEAAMKNGVKIAAGLQCRHSPARAALIDKIKSGAMGDLQYIRANRLTGRRWMGNMKEKANVLTEQLQFGKVNLLWVGSGHMIDNLIHQIDECCWLMDEWPESCHGMGGREVHSDDHGQNNDIYSMEFTFPSGRKAFCGFRRTQGGFRDFATFVHCSKKAGQFSGNVHKATVHMFKDQRISDDNIEWSPTPDTHSPWDYEWIDFVHSIRNDKPHNEAQRACYADYTALLGRAAAHLNRVVTWDEVVNSKFQFCDYLDDLTMDSPPPVKADKDGYFPAADPGIWKEL